MSIERFFTHTVDIVYITMTAGIRSEVISADVPAFITQKVVVLRDESGDHFGTKNIVFLKGDTTINEIDELIVDEKQRPITKIFRVRTRSAAIHHLEVEVQ